jgi:nuclear pore complex protein Nup98-Nup96
LDDSDEESDEEMGPPPAPDTPPQRVSSNHTAFEDMEAREDGPTGYRQNAGLPGTFDEHEALYEREDAGKQSFLGVSSADSAPNDVRLSLEENYASDMGDEYDLSEDEDMTRSSFGQHPAAELDDASSVIDQDTKRGTPGGILRARMRAMKDQVGPVTLEVADGDDWMEMLRKTVSPVKRDRQLLREMNDSPCKLSFMPNDDDDDNSVEDLRKSSIWGKSIAKAERPGGFASAQIASDKGRGFATSIDLMNSLFEKPKPVRQNVRDSVPAKGFPKVGTLLRI